MLFVSSLSLSLSLVVWKQHQFVLVEHGIGKHRRCTLFLVLVEHRLLLVERNLAWTRNQTSLSVRSGLNSEWNRDGEHVFVWNCDGARWCTHLGLGWTLRRLGQIKLNHDGAHIKDCAEHRVVLAAQGFFLLELGIKLFTENVDQQIGFAHIVHGKHPSVIQAVLELFMENTHQGTKPCSNCSRKNPIREQSHARTVRHG